MLHIGDIFFAEVRDLASDGRGIIAHPSGRTFFVSGVWLQERGQFKIIGLKGRVGFAELVALEAASPHRRTAPCKFHGFSDTHCGGCPWQFVEYSAQIEAKQARVEKAFNKLGLESPVRPILASPIEYGYRNRAQLKTNGERLGYVAARSNKIAQIDDCLILNEKNRITLRNLKALLPKPEWRPAKKRNWTTLDIDDSVDAPTVAVNERLPFSQGNSEQNQIMLSWLANKLSDLDKNRSVLELFCGSGNFTAVISACEFKKILAVEVVEAALEVLEARKFPNVETYLCNLYADDAFAKMFYRCPNADILILDPPREGLKNKVGLAEKLTQIKDIFYISCDLATLTRDLEYFQDQGFSVLEVQPLDMFPQTAHIEILVQLGVR